MADAGAHTAALIKASAKNPHGLVGIVSTAPGLSLGAHGHKNSKTPHVPLALAGRVPVKFSLENGPVMVGDKLTLGTQAGTAARATPGDITIGTALETFTKERPGTNRMVMTLVHLDYSEPRPSSVPMDPLDEIRASIEGLKRENARLRRRVKRLERRLRRYPSRKRARFGP